MVRFKIQAVLPLSKKYATKKHVTSPLMSKNTISIGFFLRLKRYPASKFHVVPTFHRFLKPLVFNAPGFQDSVGFHCSRPFEKGERRCNTKLKVQELGIQHHSKPLLGCPRKLGPMARITGLFHLLINVFFGGYNPLTNLLLTSWDIHV